MADCVASRMASWSRASKRVHRYPGPRANPRPFREAITRLAEKLDPILIVPTCEEVFHLSTIEPIASRLFAPTRVTLKRLHSKMSFAEDCVASGLSSPETVRVTSKTGIDAFAGEPDNWVFKPEFSRFGTQALIGPDAKSLRDLKPSDTTPWVAQRRIRGIEVCFYAVSFDSRLAAFSAYRSSWRFGGGAGYAFEPLAAGLFERLREIAATLAAKLVPRGQFACDAIVDDSGKPWLIECNPRATSGAHLFGRSPELALAMLGRRDGLLAGTTAGSHVAPALWFYGLPEALRRGRMREWTSARRTGSDVIGAPRDRAPVLGALIDSTRFSVKALAKRKSLPEVMTDDIEWNGEDF